MQQWQWRGSIFPRSRGVQLDLFYFVLYFNVLEKARGMAGISHAITLAIKSTCESVGEYRWKWRGSKQQQRKCSGALSKRKGNREYEPSAHDQFGGFWRAQFRDPQFHSKRKGSRVRGRKIVGPQTVFKISSPWGAVAPADHVTITEDVASGSPPMPPLPPKDEAKILLPRKKIVIG